MQGYWLLLYHQHQLYFVRLHRGPCTCRATTVLFTLSSLVETSIFETAASDLAISIEDASYADRSRRPCPWLHNPCMFWRAPSPLIPPACFSRPPMAWFPCLRQGAVTPHPRASGVALPRGRGAVPTRGHVRHQWRRVLHLQVRCRCADQEDKQALRDYHGMALAPSRASSCCGTFEPMREQLEGAPSPSPIPTPLKSPASLHCMSCRSLS